MLYNSELGVRICLNLIGSAIAGVTGEAGKVGACLLVQSSPFTSSVSYKSVTVEAK